MAFMGWLFNRADDADGRADALASRAAGSPEPEAVTEAEASGGRRGRALLQPRAALEEAVAQKVLHAWLQNRHQTLMPLTLNLRALPPEGAALLLRGAAVAMLATGSVPDAAQRAEALQRLGAAGENAARLLDDALSAPPPLSLVLAEAQVAGLAPQLYAASVVGTGRGGDGDAAARAFLGYLAARLGLPANVVRSAERRYRR